MYSYSTTHLFNLGGGIASNESTLGLPLHVNDVEYLRPHINFLAHVYGLTVVRGKLHILNITLVFSLKFNCNMAVANLSQDSHSA